MTGHPEISGFCADTFLPLRQAFEGNFAEGLETAHRWLLGLDRPVAEYWPDFGKHGKQEITVREAMTHRALVPGSASHSPGTFRMTGTG